MSMAYKNYYGGEVALHSGTISFPIHGIEFGAVTKIKIARLGALFLYKCLRYKHYHLAPARHSFMFELLVL